jgi:N-acyl homoserine lactone hydrolase
VHPPRTYPFIDTSMYFQGIVIRQRISDSRPMTTYFPYSPTGPVRRWIQFFSCLVALATLGPQAVGCVASRHATTPASLGQASTNAAMLATLGEPGKDSDGRHTAKPGPVQLSPAQLSPVQPSPVQPSPVRLSTVVVADWAVPLSGLLNLNHPKAKAAGLEDREEKIQIYLHVIEHPRFGTYLVDSGMAEAFRTPETNPHLSFIVKKAMNTDALVVRKSTAQWIAETGIKPAGVFLTHIHLDHIMGLPDLAEDTPVYTGPAETGAENLVNMFSAGSTDSLLKRQGPLQEWRFESDLDGLFDAVVDVFGDGSVWALHVPGHSPGSTAFLVRSTEGPVLLVGDASHTNWGWNNGVEPGTYSHDQPRSIASLAALRELVTRFPEIDVRLGHQPFVAPVVNAAS